MTALRKNADFLEHAYHTVWMAAGASEEHAAVVARSVSMADRMRKYRQGLPVLEYLFLALEVGNLDIKAVPSIVSEGSSWVLYDANRSSGHWALTLATKAAIVKAREVGVAIGMARNHGDTGMCYAYTSLAVEQDMLAMATNNTGPQVSPWGGMVRNPVKVIIQSTLNVIADSTVSDQGSERRDAGDGFMSRGDQFE